jgi:F0F1-type ATP synthase membrane subunit a
MRLCVFSMLIDASNDMHLFVVVVYISLSIYVCLNCIALLLFWPLSWSIIIILIIIITTTTITIIKISRVRRVLRDHRSGESTDKIFSCVPSLLVHPQTEDINDVINATKVYCCYYYIVFLFILFLNVFPVYFNTISSHFICSSPTYSCLHPTTNYHH